MSQESFPGAGLYTPEQLASLREIARRRALEKAGLSGAPTPEAPRPVRRPVYSAPPSIPVPAVSPSHTPTSSAVRVSRAPRTTSSAQSVQEIIPSPKALEKHDGSEKKKSNKALKTVIALSLAGAALYGANQAGLLGAENITGVTSAGFIGGDAEAESKYGEILLPTVAGPEGLNIENCKNPGAAIATIRLTGNYAIRYQLQTPENTVVVPLPYMSEGALSEGEGANAENKKFETQSGYPEMTIHDLPLEIYACEKPNTAAVTQAGGVDTINVANIDFTVKPAVPAEQDNKIQTEAYMSSLGPATFYTWPSQTFLTSNPERYTDASVQAATAAHNGADQQIGVFNTAIRSILANASNADIDSQFNQAVTFAQQDVDTVYEAIKEGLEVRLGSQNIEWNGTISNLTPMVSDKKPTLVDTSATPEESFTVEEGEVIVGRYAPIEEDEE